MNHLNLLALMAAPGEGELPAIVSVLVSRGLMEIDRGPVLTKLGLERTPQPMQSPFYLSEDADDPDLRIFYALKFAHQARADDMNDARPDADDPLYEWKRSVTVSWFLEDATEATTRLYRRVGETWEPVTVTTYSRDGVDLVHPDYAGLFHVWQ